MPLTPEQLSDFRADLGDTGASPAFTDAELERLYARASENYAGAVVMALNQLLASAAKLADYTQNQTQEKRSQVFDHLQALRVHWVAQATTQQPTFRIARLGVRRRKEDTPHA